MSLRSFECEGPAKYLSVVIATVPEALPQLESFTVKLFSDTVCCYLGLTNQFLDVRATFYQ
jgi:hypothetical protein